MPKITTSATTRGVLGDANSGAVFTDETFTSVYIGGATKETTAILEAESTSQGALFPRMTEAQRDAIVSPATGLVIYNTDTNTLNVYSGASWGAVGGGGASTPVGLYTISSAGSGSISGTGVAITWRDPATSASLYDSSGFYQSGAPTQLLIPENGVYEVIASISLIGTTTFSTSASWTVECQRSGGFLAGATVAFRHNGIVAVAHGIFDLQANDTVLAKYTQTTSVSHSGMDISIKKI